MPFCPSCSTMMVAATEAGPPGPRDNLVDTPTEWGPPWRMLRAPSRARTRHELLVRHVHVHVVREPLRAHGQVGGDQPHEGVDVEALPRASSKRARSAASSWDLTARARRGPPATTTLKLARVDAWRLTSSPRPTGLAASTRRRRRPRRQAPRATFVELLPQGVLGLWSPVSTITSCDAGVDHGACRRVVCATGLVIAIFPP